MSLYKILAAFFLIAAVSTESKDDATGGQVAEEGQFPFVVSVQYNGTHKCGGSIMDWDKILTSATCIQEILNNHKNQNKTELLRKLRVVAGTTHWNTTANSKRSGNKQIAEVIKFDVSNHYNVSAPEMGHDWSVLILNETFNATEEVKRIELQPSGSELPTEFNLFATLAGWGNTTTTNFDQLHYGHLVTLPGCIKDNISYSAPNDSFCATWVGDGVPSDGNRGSPLFISIYNQTTLSKYIQIGILSYTNETGVEGEAEYNWIFTEVRYASAAQNHMSILVHIFIFVSAYFLI